MLKDVQIPVSMVCFQCYDTTASMSGTYNGAQAKFSEHLEQYHLHGTQSKSPYHLHGTQSKFMH